MEEVIKDGVVLAKHIKPSAWKDGLSFFSKDEDYIQVGTWKYQKGKELLAHIHNEVKRTITRTQEVLYVVSGAVEATIYDLSGIEVSKLIVNSGEVLVLLNCGHGYKILSNDTHVLEIKNGPYLGADIDRKRI